MNGNKIHLKDIGYYEVEIAKCGLLRLVWITSPLYGNKFEIRSNGEKIHETNYIWESIKKYNELVI